MENHVQALNSIMHGYVSWVSISPRLLEKDLFMLLLDITLQDTSKFTVLPDCPLRALQEYF